MSTEEKDYRDIQSLYASEDCEQVLHLIGTFRRSYPNSRLIGKIESFSGLCYLHLKQPEQAIPSFKAAIQAESQSETFVQAMLFNQARAEYEAGRLGDAMRTLDWLDPQFFDGLESLLRYHALRAIILLGNAQPQECARELLKTSRLFEQVRSKELRNSYAEILDRALEKLGGVEPLRRLYREFPEVPLTDQLLYRLALREKSLGYSAKAKLHFADILIRFPMSRFRTMALREDPSRGDPIPLEPNTVGVLLPLSGKFAQYGKTSLQAIELAFRVFDDWKAIGQTTLVIEDAGETPEDGVRALERLVLKHHVIGVIGPLVVKGAGQVAQRAQELGVPMISLSRQTTSVGDFVINGGLTFQRQSEQLARYAIQKLKLKNFAILAPKDWVGQEFANTFWNAVEKLGGQITAYETYDPAQTDFREEVDKLSGLYYTGARSLELKLLGAIRKKNHITKKTRKTAEYFNLKPIVDYEAVFIPDQPKVIGLALPTFTYRDIDQLYFLGPSVWNVPDLPKRAEKQGARTIFVDAFFPKSSIASVREFIEAYQGVFNEDPTSMEAIAYDAAFLLNKALNEGGEYPRSRRELLVRLQGQRPYDGVTGTLLNDDGVLSRELRFFTIRSGKISEIR